MYGYSYCKKCGDVIGKGGLCIGCSSEFESKREFPITKEEIEVHDEIMKKIREDLEREGTNV